MKFAICDDMQAERLAIKEFMMKYFEANDVYFDIDEFESGEALLCSDISEYALIFMDIFMDKITGMETAKKLISINSKTQIVFCTTSTQFAVEAFDIDALHYIVKPVGEMQLFNLLDRFFDNYYNIRTINVKIGRLEESIYISDILYVEAKRKTTLIHSKKGLIEASNNLSEIYDMLVKYDFVKPIRWAIVSVREIIAVTHENIELSDGTQIPIKRGMSEEIKNIFAEYKWKQMKIKMRGR